MTAGTGVVSGVRVSHDRASLDDVEAACHPDTGAVVERLLAVPGVGEAFALQTCNRFEAYVVTDEPTTGRAVLADFAPDAAGHVTVEMGHEESLRHLMRVAAGLESLVLGEDQIIGQVRDAYETARECGAIGPMLEDAVTKAIHVGKRARTETAINEGAVSVGSAAVELLAQHCDLADATALVVGAGEMGSLAAHALADAEVETLYVANRSPANAAELANEVDHDDARAVSLDGLASALDAADAVVSATGSEDHVLDASRLADRGDTLVVDIAQPRDVSPAADALDGVTVHDMSALESVTGETERRRREAAESVEAMIDREFERLLEGYKRKRADEVIATMYESAERIKAREVSEALTKLDAHGDFTDDQREVVESMADALVSQLLAPPTKSLRDAAAEDDWTTINTALQLFDPEFGDGEGPSEATVRGDEIPDAVLEELSGSAPVAADDDD
ncbi:glutamyl-tRNA reductase [Halorussus salilacus]|uniref:glutamyl-tRNA reductase n=1 Tax=Halorussus salilacus TaxID=2953750 RepID=UPI00209C71C7|nr:glutamyl-tRNA reductase [Halorussus salilacus]USZ69678.1 glutamyl-tRNA reductase [Halorussus salilacus]